MSSKGLFAAFLLFLGTIIAFNSLYVVTEYERAVVLQFGRLVDMDVKPGLHAKIPFAEKVRKFDGRLLTADMVEASFFTVENKRLIVDSYIKWRILDVEAYYKATGGVEDLAVDRLAQRVADGLRNQFGRRTLHDVVSGKRDELMKEITQSINEEAIKLLGVEVKDIRVKRVDFPAEVSRPVYDRMAADREKEAREYRAQGKEQAEVISADADKQRAVLEANAFRDAERIRGEGDAKAAAIYAAAFSKDPEFYSFVRSLNAYKTSFGTKDDLMVIDPNSDFFRYLKNAKGKN
ncbi:protease modulator HflC [Cellvibrio japonicus]|uniref:Protein HflC n=1 Tax=Cellvibrio japonicus (strain Ueda107) TaxID=498211 RepID=B3PDB8_CELJU|nr:protease modulator HflC [Cellvibrio japonicus]ACE84834.1 HflC protein [Cellvibrio japonicus Ueda107]QEI13371.1 protease modulator HflC [Cellvibrio japonicus]QEI16945.1 protease modulator HflC [Cellvibrio japonicus]QEI20523.1 protease modulator HflC [Cellvibrio japonicus]